MIDRYFLLSFVTRFDNFRKMPTSAQALFFHYVIEAAVGGSVVNVDGLIKAVGATEEDLYTLIKNGFIDCMHVDGTGVMRVSRWSDSIFEKIEN